MDIKAELLKEHSKKQTTKIARYIGIDKELFADLMKLFLYGEYIVTQRAARCVNECVEKYPGLIHPYLKQIIGNLDRHVHDAVRRNTLRILQLIELPESLFGIVTERCFQFLASKSEPVAVKVFAMQVLFNISEKEPGLKNELRLLIEEQMPYASAGFKARGTHILQAL
jgi:hypothetical protein